MKIYNLDKELIHDLPTVDDPRNADFSDLDLRYADFSRINLSKSLFTGSDLTGASFYQARLFDCNFDGACLNDADFSWAKLWGSRLNKVSANRGNFENASVREASLCDSSFRSAVFTWANLEDSFFNGSDITSANFECSFCFNTRFINTRYRGANFDRAAYLDFVKLGDGYELDVKYICSQLDSQGVIYTPTGFIGRMVVHQVIRKWESRFEDQFDK